ncbi:hypothetical protein [Aquimarina latercula]|uniref:hypothetical protein n=1 Tax=Aquimarina latercula TaxID=987 RepID=UPI000412D4E1|nr:hypothetical protein [Aquimarina latercula]
MILSKLLNNNRAEDNLLHFACLVSLARIDGEIDIQEQKTLEKLATELKITQDQFDNLLSNTDKVVIEPIKSFSNRLQYVYNFFKVIYTNKELGEKERGLVKQYISSLGFNEENTVKLMKTNKKVFEENLGLSEYEYFIFGD